MNSETWYEIYSSRAGADDWFRHSTATYDTEEAALAAAHEGIWQKGFDCKILKVTRAEQEAKLLPAHEPINWFEMGVLLREATLDAHENELIAVDDAYCFFIENPECFGREDWPAAMPPRAPQALKRGYHSDPAHSNANGDAL